MKRRLTVGNVGTALAESSEDEITSQREESYRSVLRAERRRGGQSLGEGGHRDGDRHVSFLSALDLGATGKGERLNGARSCRVNETGAFLSATLPRQSISPAVAL